jgi:hypothetical protein
VYDAARPAGLGTLQVDEWVLDVPDVDPLLGSFGRVSGGCCVENQERTPKRDYEDVRLNAKRSTLYRPTWPLRQIS